MEIPHQRFLFRVWADLQFPRSPTLWQPGLSLAQWHSTTSWPIPQAQGDSKAFRYASYGRMSVSWRSTVNPLTAQGWRAPDACKVKTPPLTVDTAGHPFHWWVPHPQVVESWMPIACIYWKKSPMSVLPAVQTRVVQGSTVFVCKDDGLMQKFQ